jgi:hypothetical protein
VPRAPRFASHYRSIFGSASSNGDTNWPIPIVCTLTFSFTPTTGKREALLHVPVHTSRSRACRRFAQYADLGPALPGSLGVLRQDRAAAVAVPSHGPLRVAAGAACGRSLRSSESDQALQCRWQWRLVAVDSPGPEMPAAPPGQARHRGQHAARRRPARPRVNGPPKRRGRPPLPG